jgi:hypothetical protein
MTFKKKIYLVILGLVGQLSFFGPIATESLEASENALVQEVSVPASVPEKDRLTLVYFSPLILEGEVIGALAAYHDPMTKRAADYFELYNSGGDLLAVSWFDRFGIQKMAVDRGLLGKGDELEGVFVLLLEGDSI